MTRGLVVVAVVAACGDPPPLSIDYALATQSDTCVNSQRNTATSCSNVALPCAAYLFLNIVDPANPDVSYYSTCKAINTGPKDLCSIAGIDLGDPNGNAVDLPDKTLQVQVAIYPGELPAQCPSPPTFGDDGMVSGGTPLPAIGGAAYYHPGDAKTIVTLGCKSQPDLETCTSTSEVAVTATAIDFDTDLGVSSTLAENLKLAVGEPTLVTDGFALSPDATSPLTRNTSSSVPSWGADVTQMFQHYACVEVLDESSSTITPVLTCQPAVPSATTVDFTAIRISQTTLTGVLRAATVVGGVPANGITIGVVLDYTGQPVAGATVTSSDSSSTVIQYLSADRTNVAGIATSVNGIFVAYPLFGSSLTAHAESAMLPTMTKSAVGGKIDGKVTAVVLQFAMPTGN